jgi:hypothetical protein
MKGKKLILITVCLAVFGGPIGCANESVGGALDLLNPYGEDAPPNAGRRDNSAILNDGGSANGQTEEQRARQALEVMGSYRRAQEPQPYYPVMQPAEVRLMWVPDHLNRVGDLVPAHYYYLKVKEEGWAVQDSFEVDDQLHPERGTSSSTPWTYIDANKAMMK